MLCLTWIGEPGREAQWGIENGQQYWLGTTTSTRAAHVHSTCEWLFAARISSHRAVLLAIAVQNPPAVDHGAQRTASCGTAPPEGVSGG
jgi:hypothetical protein